MQFAGSNAQWLGDNQEISNLPTFNGFERISGYKAPVIISAWKMTDEELAEFMRTGMVYLTVFTTQLPPVNITPFNPFEDKQRTITDKP